MVNGYNDNMYLTELWVLTDLIYVKYLGHDWHMINENLFRVFQREKAFIPSLSLKHRQWCPESSSETSWLLIFDTKSVSQWS